MHLRKEVFYWIIRGQSVLFFACRPRVDVHLQQIPRVDIRFLQSSLYGCRCYAGSSPCARLRASLRILVFSQGYMVGP
jgi:hypothetical protein